MKIFQNKGIWKKLIIMLLIILSFQLVAITPTAASQGDLVTSLGGKLLSPIIGLVLIIGDGINDVMHKAILNQDISYVITDLVQGLGDTIRSIALGVVVGLGVLALVIITAGLAGMAAAAIGITATVSIGTGAVLAATGIGIVCGVWYNQECLPDTTFLLPLYSLSPEEIFKGEIPVFNVNFFDDTEDQYINENDEVESSVKDTAYELRTMISTWYNSLRNIAIVFMMSILLYVGIRILLSSVSSDKAKYKEMLKDWLIGMVLLFFMHYIMVFAVTIVELIVDSLSGIENSTLDVVTIPDDEANKISEAVTDLGYEDLIQTDEEGNKYIAWPTNLMGSMRLRAQMSGGDSSYIGYGICYIVLIMYTIFFVFTYIKRIIYLAFLTMIAPLVAMTYPIDKLTDGKAQGFDSWLKEYIFNLLIQPLHLILYTILVSSAYGLVGTNIIYGLVAIGFILPAEKVLRGFFGFSKSETAGSLAGAAAGGAMIASAMKSLGKGKGGKGKEGKGKNGESGEGETSEKDNNQIREVESGEDDADEMLEESAELEDREEIANMLGVDANSDEVENGSVHNIGYQLDDNDKDRVEELRNNLKQRKIKESQNQKTNNKEAKNQNKSKNDYEKKSKEQKKIRNQQIRRKIKKDALSSGGKAVSKSIGTTAGVLAGGTAATIGLAAGIATGDAGNAAKFAGGAGLAVGASAYSAGSKAKFVSPKGQIRKMQDNKMKRKLTDAGYEEYQRDNQIKDWMKNKDNQLKIKEKLDKDDYDKLYGNKNQPGELNKFFDNGISNVDDIINTKKLQKETGLDTKTAIHTTKLSNKMGRLDKMKPKEEKEWFGHINDKIDKNSRISTSQKDAKKSEARKNLEVLDRIKYH